VQYVQYENVDTEELGKRSFRPKWCWENQSRVKFLMV